MVSHSEAIASSPSRETENLCVCVFVQESGCFLKWEEEAVLRGFRAKMTRSLERTAEINVLMRSNVNR